MAIKYERLALDEAAVERISESVRDYLAAQGMERRNVLRIRLTVEELLLNVMAGCGRNVSVNWGMGRRLGRQVFCLRYAGAPLDPTKSGGDDWTEATLRTLGYFPAWSYRGGTNTVSLVLSERARHSALFYIMIAVLAAAALGFAGKLCPEALRTGVDEALLTPAANGFLGLMGTFSGVMIAFTICSGILGVGDAVALGRLGRRILARFTGISFAVCAVTVALVCPLLSLRFSAGGEGRASQISQISRMFFDILPSNPIEPFQTGNTMQIIVIALFAGIGLLAIGERGSRLRGLIDEGAALTQRTVTFVCGFVPLFVFVMLLRQLWFGRAQALLAIWKPLVLIVSSEILIAAALWLLTALRLKCPPLTLLKKALPPFVVAFTTASSMSALTLSMETCEKKLGVEGSVVSFAYPLGTVMYMPASIASFAAIACTFAEIYQVEVSLSWMIMAVITVTLLVIAMPPIPGAGILVYTILFARMGIPAEALVLATAIDVVVDFCNTGFNVLLLVLQIVGEAGALGSLDRAALLNQATH